MQKYSCKTCGAELYWDSQAGCLKCEYCDSEFQVSDFENNENEKTDKKIKEQKAEENSTATDDSESKDLVVYKCTECGAEIITAKSTIATTCAYCGRAVSLTNKIVGNFKPDMVIPFAITKEKAEEIYKKYCNSTFLTPKHFKDENELKKMKGIYVPFWLHSFTDNAKTTLHCENITSRREGDDKVVIHHQYRVNMETEGKFEKIPTDALQNLDNALMDSLEPFNYDKLEEFNPAYMAGYYAEHFNDSSDETTKRAKSRASTAMQQKAIENAGNYNTKGISLHTDNILDYNCDYVMLPVWLFNTEYKGKKYTFAINGESGKITGKLPLSISKLLITAGSSVLITQLIALILRLFS